MKYKSLPVIERLYKLPPSEFAQAVETIKTELRRSEGFQLLLFVLRDIESAALTALMTGNGCRSPEFYAGQLSALNLFRTGVDALVPDATPTDWQDEVSDVEDLPGSEAAEA